MSLCFNPLFLSVMKKVLCILFACLWAFMMSAQENKTLVGVTDTVAHLHAEPVFEPVGQQRIGEPYGDFRQPEVCLSVADTLRLPSLDRYGQARINMYPLDWGGFYNWDLHSGLNVNIGMSVFATFGHSAWRGTGFSQNISAMYAVPLTGRLSLAVGGWLVNMSWSHDSFHDAGLNAVLGYKFDEHWEGYIYGQKSLVDKRLPYPFYDVNGVGDRIGAAVKYNFNPNFSIQVSVERGNN